MESSSETLYKELHWLALTFLRWALPTHEYTSHFIRRLSSNDQRFIGLSWLSPLDAHHDREYLEEVIIDQAVRQRALWTVVVAAYMMRSKNSGLEATLFSLGSYLLEELEQVEQPNVKENAWLLSESDITELRSISRLSRFSNVLERNYMAGTEAAQESDQETAFINVVLKTLEGSELKNTVALHLGIPYELEIYAALERNLQAVISRELDPGLRSSTDEPVEVMVHLESEDFAIEPKSQALYIQKTGESVGRVRFQVVPKIAGLASITALFLRAGNYVQLLTIKLQVDDTNSDSARQPDLTRPYIEVAREGRPLKAVGRLKPRDLTLMIKSRGNSFEFTMAHVGHCDLNLTEHELAGYVDMVRVALQKIVTRRAYVTGIDITHEQNAATLPLLAKAGYDLYQALFYGTSSDPATQHMGRLFREVAEGTDQLRIQIITDRFLIPWGILYMADDFDPENVDPERFLGLKHIVECVPMQQPWRWVDNAIEAQYPLRVGLNLNLGIDKEVRQPVVDRQLAYWGGLEECGVVSTTQRTREIEVRNALASKTMADQVSYFYCHAAAKSPPDRSYLQLTSLGAALTLNDLKIVAPIRMDRLLPDAPLMILNACESSALSPVFYDGFVPYFIMKGARGVVGTECGIPAVFAESWANRFFDGFLAGEPLGQLLLRLRREFFYKHNNALGLLYVLCGDSDTFVNKAPAEG